MPLQLLENKQNQAVRSVSRLSRSALILPNPKPLSTESKFCSLKQHKAEITISEGILSIGNHNALLQCVESLPVC